MNRSWISTIGALALSLALLAGCSSDSDDNGEEAGPDTPAATSEDGGDTDDGGSDTSAGSTKKPTVNEVRDSQGSIEGYEGALEDATVETCETVDGNLEVAGTVTNPLDDPRQYRIYVSVMEGDETRGVVQVEVEPVEASVTAFWSASLAIPDPGVTCLLRVERFEPL